MVVLRGWCWRELFWFDGIIRMDGWAMTKTCSHETCFTDRERDAHGEKKRQHRSVLLRIKIETDKENGQGKKWGVKGNSLKARQLKTIEVIRIIES